MLRCCHQGRQWFCAAMDHPEPGTYFLMVDFMHAVRAFPVIIIVRRNNSKWYIVLYIILLSMYHWFGLSLNSILVAWVQGNLTKVFLFKQTALLLRQHEMIRITEPYLPGEHFYYCFISRYFTSVLGDWGQEGGLHASVSVSGQYLACQPCQWNQLRFTKMQAKCVCKLMLH